MELKTLERKASLAGALRDTDKRTVRAALSSETPVRRFFGDEILRHTDESIDLSRAADNGLPLLVNHNDGALPIGRVRNIALEGDVLRGDLVFSEATQGAREAWDLAAEGTLSDVSVRYSIDSYEVRDEGKPSETYEVTRWTPLEASVVGIPADPSVGINRNLEGIRMPEPTEPKAPAVPTPTPDPSASRKAGIDEGRVLERQRVADIDSIAGNFLGHPAAQDLRKQAIADGVSSEQFMRQLLGVLDGSPAEPSGHRAPPTTHSGPHIQAGPDGSDKLARGVVEALNFRAGNLKGDDKALDSARNSEFANCRLIELGRRLLETGGISTRGMSELDMAGAMLTQSRFIDPGTANLATTDFPAILENVLNKSLFLGFEEAPVTWNIWCGTGSGSDFKAGTRPGVSQFTSLAVVAENGEVQDGIVTDKKEAFQIETYARKFSVTRQTIVNDDLGGLADVARKMGGAAGRTVDEQVYAFLEANGNMAEDTTALFDEIGHNNLPAAAGDPSVDNIGLARERMGLQTDWNGVILGIVPQFMVCPIQKEQKMLEISTLNADPQRVRRDNVYRQMWQPVATPRLTNAADWYMFGAKGEHIDVIFLNGSQAPMMARDEGWSVLAAHWRVVLDFDVMAVDYRSAIKFDHT